MGEYHVVLRELFDKQRAFKRSKAKRKVGRIGRRGGKTTLAADISVEDFLDGRRVLYAVPTSDQLDRWWLEVCTALAEPVEAGIFYKNETRHIIELAGTDQRIRGKTAWNANTLRGDYADKLILDEWQHMDEDAWELVGAPMLLDNNGDAVFFYTPPSLHNRSVSKAKDPQHASKLFQKATQRRLAGDKRWETFHWTSKDNPRLSRVALSEITKDMTALAYRMEILAEDVNEAPGALWTRQSLETNRIFTVPVLDRIVVAVDPTATSGGDEAGIITAGKRKKEFYPLADDSLQGSPLAWAEAAIAAYHKFKANCIVAEANNGGEMVELTIHSVKGGENVPVILVHATRGKHTRAEPIAAIYEQGRAHHIGSFPALEDELCLWQPNSGAKSPNRLDALVWAGTELMLDDSGPLPKSQPGQQSKWLEGEWEPMKKY